MASTIAVVGAGTMGSGIAQVCVAAGFAARLVDADPGALEDGRTRVLSGLDRLRAKGRLTAAERSAAVERLSTHASLEQAVEGADVVIEAASEDLVVKQGLFAALGELTSADVVLATNTSSLSVASCAAVTDRPERVIGMHFFNPAPVMPLVEVASSDATASAVEDRTIALARDLGKTPVPVADSPGFIVNRVGRPFIVEAVRMVEREEAGVATIDAALLAAGYPMGPFGLVDLIGLDVDAAINATLHVGLGDAERFRPTSLEAALIEAGRGGRKQGRGFYRYAADEEPELDAAGLPPVPSEELDAAAIVERIELAIINEAYRAVGEGVAAPPDVDTAMRLGAGHPAGPFERVDEIGLRHVVERLHHLHANARDGEDDQYEVAPMLWTIATV